MVPLASLTAFKTDLSKLALPDLSVSSGALVSPHAWIEIKGILIEHTKLKQKRAFESPFLVVIALTEKLIVTLIA